MLELINTSVTAYGLTAVTMTLCTLASLLLGLGVAACHMVRNSWSKGFVMTLVILPAIVQIVIMMVNGNLGAGVAVAGAFSLVRFRSAPGTARDIASIFFAMAIGLATGMGYLFYALLFLVLIGPVSMLLAASPFGERRDSRRTLRITIPETLDFEHVFDDPMARYTKSARLDRIKTTSMGSLFELTYEVELKDEGRTKAFLDDLRCLNGNLTVAISRPLPSWEEL